MANIIFLGTGGGRLNLLRQIRRTGGFLIEINSLRIAVDPGPGALSSLNELQINPMSIDAIIITHNHIDHMLEAPLLIEAMSSYMLKKGGTLISAKSVVKGDKKGDRCITLYHQSKLSQNIIFGAGTGKKILIEKKGKKISFRLTGVKVKHDDEDGFGFVLEAGGKRIGYTSDTEYIPSFHDAAYEKADLLIANVIRPITDIIPGHLYGNDAIKLLRAAKPKLCIMTHLGLKFLQKSPELEAARIEKESAVRTIAARDLFSYNLNSGKWGKYKKEKTKKDLQKKLAE
ncbi:hypothetical protein COU37_00440 [Candidatus Micrarchaeota archaeon CG10_big_fil_rev_8_21_14_0_10_45_29]|nr:MAG: hypothetical protein COU37_00440 [Candidatus Micrarchaeota archaeon CG10_big_fil_rev_8_21_14_0_10_45_29]